MTVGLNFEMNREEKYLVAIIVPVYNSGKYLKEAFESVQKQTIGFEKIQLIFVDDCSSDDSYKMICAWSEKYPNVFSFQTPEQSGSASLPRNIGLENVRADYLMFLDSDDLLMPDAVEFMYDSITSRDVDLFDAAFKETGKNKTADTRYVHCREGVYDSVKDAKEFFKICHPIVTKIYRNSIIKENHIKFDTDLRNGEDSHFIFSYLLKTTVILHSNKIVYEYRIRDDSVSHNKDDSYFDGISKSCDRIRELLKDTPLTEYYDCFIEAVVVSNTDVLCDSADLSDSQCRDVLMRWYNYYVYMTEKRITTNTPIGKILLEDADRDDIRSFENDFFAIRDIYKERRNIILSFTGSRGWQLITKINRILGRN